MAKTAKVKTPKKQAAAKKPSPRTPTRPAKGPSKYDQPGAPWWKKVPGVAPKSI